MMDADTTLHSTFASKHGNGDSPAGGRADTDNFTDGIINDAGDGAPSYGRHECAPVIALVRDLLNMPGSQVNFERSGGRYRLRFKIADPGTGRLARRALELPDANDLVASVAGIIHAHRHARRKAKAAIRCHDEHQWRKDIRRRLLAACPHGRIVKRRLVLVFEIAVDLGYVFLEDFMVRRPWLAKSPFHAGRRPKRA